MLERDLTYEFPCDATMPDLVGIQGVAEITDPAVQELEETLFDTPDHRLAAADVTLLRRTGGDETGWHLILPSTEDPAMRHDVRATPGRATRTVPKRLRDTLSALVAGQELVPIASICTTRTMRLLMDDDGHRLAEIAGTRTEATPVPHDRADSTRQSAQSGSTAWRHVTVELGDGGPEMLDQLADRLTAAGARQDGHRSPIRELLGAPPAGPVPATRPADPIQLLIRHRLTTQFAQLRLLHALASEDLPDGVHSMRVAVRRLRSALATCRPFLDRSVTDPLRDELGWLSDALGAARDAEVQRAHLDAALDDLLRERPDIRCDTDRVRATLCSALGGRHEDARAALADVLTGDRYAALLDRLRELVAEPPWIAAAGKRVGGAYRRRVGHDLRRVQRRMAAAQEPTLGPEQRDDALHQARKAAKRARYAAEPLREVYGGPAKRLVKALKKLQSELGLHQDAVVTRRYLLELAHSGDPALDPDTALVVGVLIERESRTAEHYAQRAFKTADKLAPLDG